jgi:hypothetical protein
MKNSDKVLLYKELKNILITEGNSGLKKWFKEKWVDISRKSKSGSHPPCGASAGKKERGSGKRKYPKCVPAAKAAQMSAKQKRSAIIRKRKHGSTSRGKAKFVSTYSKK